MDNNNEFLRLSCDTFFVKSQRGLENLVEALPNECIYASEYYAFPCVVQTSLLKDEKFDLFFLSPHHDIFNGVTKSLTDKNHFWQLCQFLKTYFNFINLGSKRRLKKYLGMGDVTPEELDKGVINIIAPWCESEEYAEKFLRLYEVLAETNYPLYNCESVVSTLYYRTDEFVLDGDLTAKEFVSKITKY